MDKNKLMYIKESLLSCVHSQIGDLKSADTKELGEAIDMIKDIEEALYYCTITEAMNKKDEETKYRYRDMEEGRMHYGTRMYEENTTPTSNGTRHQYSERPVSFNMMRDYREGRSPQMRRNYMESKEIHNDKHVQMKELENYVKELSEDLMEMIEGASVEEKQLLQKKLATLATKIV